MIIAGVEAYCKMSYDDDFSETVVEVYRAMEKARLAGRPRYATRDE